MDIDALIEAAVAIRGYVVVTVAYSAFALTVIARRRRASRPQKRRAIAPVASRLGDVPVAKP